MRPRSIRARGRASRFAMTRRRVPRARLAGTVIWFGLSRVASGAGCCFRHRITSSLEGNTTLGVVARASRALAVGNAEQAASLSKAADQKRDTRSIWSPDRAIPYVLSRDCSVKKKLFYIGILSFFGGEAPLASFYGDWYGGDWRRAEQFPPRFWPSYCCGLPCLITASGQ